MNPSPRQALLGRRFARDLWHLVAVYWSSREASLGWGLLAFTLSLELATVYGNVLLADSQRRLFDTMQNAQMGAFFSALGTLVGLIGGFLFVSAYRVYLRQLLEMRWRRFLTSHFLRLWIDPRTYGQSELYPGQIDNPDQRIAEDVKVVVASALGLALSLLAAAVTFASFAGILWSLSAHFPVPLGAADSRMPGLMVWVAVVYAATSSAITHFVGRRLVPLGVERQRVEADFRYGLISYRQNVLPVALAGGEVRERTSADRRFERVVSNWRRLIAGQRNLALVTTGIGQASGLVPLVIAAPAYFAGHFTLGSLVQTRIAYEQVVGSLAWFVYAYQEIAQWRASVERLTTFTALIDTTRTDLLAPRRLRIESVTEGEVRLVDVCLELPDGSTLVEHACGSIRLGERIVVVGPAGSGKTVLFRALAGAWPFGTGCIRTPVGARPFFLSQRPYLPIGSLREVVTYPSPSDAFSHHRVCEILRLLDLTHLENRLDGIENWEQQLSSDEQQRLAFAGVFLHEPEWIFIDDATASLAPAVEARLYESLERTLPRSTIVTFTHRNALTRFHSRQWTIVERNGRAPSLHVGSSA